MGHGSIGQGAEWFTAPWGRTQPPISFLEREIEPPSSKRYSPWFLPWAWLGLSPTTPLPLSWLRVYPVVPTNARVFYEKDIIIGDYLFPKNVSGGCAGDTPLHPRALTPSHPTDPLCPGALCHVP